MSIIHVVHGAVVGQWRKRSYLRLIVSRFMQNRLGVAGLIFTIVYFIIAIGAPFFITQEPNAMAAADRFQPPSLAHPFGTDRFGRDVFARVFYGARLSLRVSIIVVTVSSAVGVTLGLVAGYFRDFVDEAIMRIIDIMFAFPSILLALVIIAILGPGLNRAIIALAIAYIPIMARITRGSAISIAEEEYVLAAKAYGESSIGIMFREMLPNMVSAVMVQATITFAFSVLAEAGLSYLGLSAQPPTPTWGNIISQGQNTIEIAPWVSFFPGLMIMLTVLGLTFLGVGLRDAFDPKTDTSTDTLGGL